MPKYFISIDWGTTNFRLNVVEASSLDILQTISTNDGIRILADLYDKNIHHKSRKEYLRQYLINQVDLLPNSFGDSPIVLSGMASSSIGIKELDYASLPFNSDGSDLVWEELLVTNRKVILVSGVSGPNVMMRGEEIQAIGLASLFEENKEGILILPGTHSKHISFLNGVYETFTSHMTGELFEVLAKHSILSKSIQESTFTDGQYSIFQEGIETGMSGQLTAHLLAVRANQVINKIEPADNYFFLSGLLIGAELGYLKRYNSTVVLAASQPLFHLYKMALKIVRPNKVDSFFDQQVLDQATIKGHSIILNQI